VIKLKTLSLIAALLAAGILPSCGIDYQTKAVERARAYALDNTRGFDETQRDFIRYTDPSIYDKPSLDVKSRENASSSVTQTCMVWNVPGLDGSLVVCGMATQDTHDWCPVRMLVEDVSAPDKDLLEAKQKAVAFVFSRMSYLSDSERNRARFADPQTRTTAFELPKDEKSSEGKPLSRWEAYLKSKEKKVEPVQTSFIWKADADGSLVVVSGVAKKGLKGWTPVSGMLVSASELDSRSAPGWKSPAPPPAKPPEASGQN